MNYIATWIWVNTRSPWHTALGLLIPLYSLRHLICHSLKIFELTVRKLNTCYVVRCEEDKYNHGIWIPVGNHSIMTLDWD